MVQLFVQEILFKQFVAKIKLITKFHNLKRYKEIYVCMSMYDLNANTIGFALGIEAELSRNQAMIYKFVVNFKGL